MCDALTGPYSELRWSTGPAYQGIFGIRLSIRIIIECITVGTRVYKELFWAAISTGLEKAYAHTR